jgi:hypothetical protein
MRPNPQHLHALAQWGLCVRPAKGLGSLERVRLNVMGTGWAGLGGDVAHRLGQA